MGGRTDREPEAPVTDSNESYAQSDVELLRRVVASAMCGEWAIGEGLAALDRLDDRLVAVEDALRAASGWLASITEQQASWSVGDLEGAVTICRRVRADIITALAAESSGNTGKRAFSSYVTVLIEAETMEQADDMLGDWLDHKELGIATWTTFEAVDDDED